MKKLLLVFFTFTMILTGCATNCGYPTHCWKGYFQASKCGTYVVSRCARICNSCTFNEPSCMVCWDCVQHDGCGYDYSRSFCGSNYRDDYRID